MFGSDRFTPPTDADAIVLDVVIEVQLGSFLKRDLDGRIRFVSPLPFPYNYGAVPTQLGLEGDLLHALVLGPRLHLGQRSRVRAWGAVTLTDRGLVEDKLICSVEPPSDEAVRQVLHFFRFYAGCKALLNFGRRRPGRNGLRGLVLGRPGDDQGAAAAARLAWRHGAVLSAPTGS